MFPWTRCRSYINLHENRTELPPHSLGEPPAQPQSRILWHWWAPCRTCPTTGWGAQAYDYTWWVTIPSCLHSCFNPTCLGILENHWNLDSGNTAKDVSSSTTSYLMHIHLALQASKAQALKPLWCLKQLWPDNTIFTLWFLVFPYHMTNFHKCWTEKLRSHLNSITFNTQYPFSSVSVKMI